MCVDSLDQQINAAFPCPVPAQPVQDSSLEQQQPIAEAPSAGGKTCHCLNATLTLSALVISFFFAMLKQYTKRYRPGTLGRLTSRLAIAPYAVGVAFLILAARTWYGATKSPDVQRQFLAVDESFNFDALKVSDGYTSYSPATDRKSGDLLAIFTIPVDPCIDCMNEVHAFRAMLDQRGLSGKTVQTEIVVVGEDPVAARRFVKTTDFEQEIWYGSDPVHDQQLQSFGRAVVTHQMLLVDPDRQCVFSRARLALGQGYPKCSPKIGPYFKRECSQEMEASFRL